MTDIASIRREYDHSPLAKERMRDDPTEQFQQWFEEALDSKEPDPNAMTLATATADGRPSARIVLLKNVDERGFTFYTNYKSQKGRELEANPQASLVFWWRTMDRQVSVGGEVSRLSAEESEVYFQSRPRESQLGAWASPQSEVIADRSTLESNMERLQKKFAGEEQIPCPPHWGGYLLRPDEVVFWQGRPRRLHDRLRYRQTDEGEWILERLAP